VQCRALAAELTGWGALPSGFDEHFLPPTAGSRAAEKIFVNTVDFPMVERRTDDERSRQAPG